MKEKTSPSVTQKAKGLTVAPSPFNSVKLDLGIIIVGAALLWIVANRIIGPWWGQILLLAAYGITGMSWIIFKINHIIRTLPTKNTDVNSDWET